MKNILLIVFIILIAISSANCDEVTKLDYNKSGIENVSKPIDSKEDTTKELDNRIDSVKKDTDTITIVKISGENENKNESCDFCGIIGSAIGAIISAYVSLIIYRRGEKNREKEKIGEIVDFGEDIFILTSDTVRSWKIQIKAINEYSIKAQKEPYKAHVLNRVPIHQMERIRSFEIDKVKKVFRQLNLSNKDFINFYNQIDFLSEVYSAMNEDYEETNSEFITPFANEFLKLRQEILNDTSNYLESQRKKGDTSSDLYVFINNLLIKYIQSIHGILEPNIKHDFDNFIDVLIIELASKYREYSITSTIMNKLQRAKELYISTIASSEHFRLDLISRIELFNSSIEILSNINDKFENIYGTQQPL